MDILFKTIFKPNFITSEANSEFTSTLSTLAQRGTRRT